MALSRTSSCRLLAIVAAICLFLANLGIWAHTVIYDRLGYRTTARAIFDKPEVQREVAQRAVTALIGEGEERGSVADALEARMVDRLAEALGSPAMGLVLDRVLDFSWRVMVEREPKPVVLEATALRAIGLALAEEHDPKLAERIRALPKPLRIHVLDADDIPSAAPYRGPVRALIWICLGLTLVLGALSVRLAPDAARATRRMGVLTALPAAVLAGIVLLLPALAADGMLLEIAIRVVLGRLLWQCGLLILLGVGLYWIGHAGGWLRNIDKRLERIESLLSRESPRSE